jgi:hypothetical protein
MDDDNATAAGHEAFDLSGRFAPRPTLFSAPSTRPVASAATGT